MAAPKMTIEEIDKHLYVHAERLGIKNVSAPLTAQQLQALNICGIYTTIRPILSFAQTILNLFKPTWASVVGTFMGAMDISCAIPAGTPK